MREIREMQEKQFVPKTLTIVRHAVSVYNDSRAARDNDPEYQEFRRAYDADMGSAETRRLARRLRGRLIIPGGEEATPIKEELAWQAEETGRLLPRIAEKPDIIVVSPYRRTKQTLEAMKRGRPVLGRIETVEEPRLREREHGLLPYYGDKRIFFTFHPEQRELFERKGEFHYQYPEGENMSEVETRVARWLMELKYHMGRHMLIITHHETILAIRMLLEGLLPEDIQQIDEEDKPINCGVTTYRDFGRGLRLTGYNQNLFEGAR